MGGFPLPPEPPGGWGTGWHATEPTNTAPMYLVQADEQFIGTTQ